ncbi:glycosyltransferase family 2 protein [Photobacterium damselae]
MKKVSFIIRTLNEGDYLEKTLKSIYSQTYRNTEVIVVDSGSTDKTIEIALKYDCSVINISKDDWSWGRSLNLGIENSSGDIICVTSGHCILGSDDFLIKALSKLEDSDVIFGKQNPLPNLDPYEEYELYKWYPSVYINNTDAIKAGKGVGVSNACNIFHKNVWENIKFDENLQSMEDAEWATRVAFSENIILYCPDIYIYHSHPFDIKYIYRKWYCRQFEGYCFFNKYYGFYKRTKKNILSGYAKKCLKFLMLPYYVYDFNKTNNYKLTYLKISGYFLIRDIADLQAYNHYMKNKTINYWGVDNRFLNKIVSKIKMGDF